MKRLIVYLLFASALLSSASAVSAFEPEQIPAQNGFLYGVDATERQMETLDRGLSVIHTSEGNYLSWRLFPDEDSVYGTARDNIEFEIYKNGSKIATEKYSTNYTDIGGTSSDKYSVSPLGGEKCAEVTSYSSDSNYFDIQLDRPDALTLADGNTYDYTIGDTSCGDLDGDGQYELVIKWDCNPKDNSQAAYTGNVLLDAYDMYTGEKLWRIDLGQNIRAGAHYTQFLVYDFDMDGKAEVACKTAPGSKDGRGEYVTKASSVDEIKRKTDDDNSTSYVNTSGYIITGDEYFTAFNGETGAAIDTIYFPVQRVSADVWGDSHGNRCDRYAASVAWLDGERPYAVYWRGYYHGRNGRQRLGTCGISLENGVLNPKYVFDTEKGQRGYTAGNEKYVGQGNHNMTVADVDNDGKDEYISATLCFEVNDNDTLVPKWFNNRQHGDALHIGNYDPTNSGYEYFTVHEDYPHFGMTVINPETGNEELHVPADRDTGRGMMANVGMGGYYQIRSLAGTYIAYGNGRFEEVNIGMGENFRIFWDGDLYDELLDGTSVSSWNGAGMSNIFTAEGCLSVNSTKSNPALQADLFGDWREELVYPFEGNNALRVFTTNIPTEYKMKTLMSDSMYRSGVASEQTAYNQPPHISMYLDDTLIKGELKSVEITHPPLKTEYIEGQMLDRTGLVLMGTYDNGLVSRILHYEVSGYDPKKLGEQTITVTAGGQSTEYTVTVKEGTTYYTEDFENYNFAHITMGRQGKEGQSQSLGNLKLEIGARANGGDNTSGYVMGKANNNTFLSAISGSVASVGRGASFTFSPECYLPQIDNLADGKEFVIDFAARYNSENSSMQIYGITNSTVGSSSNLPYDPYLSVKNNSAIPLNEWVHVKVKINNKLNANISITNYAGEEVYNKDFKAEKNIVERFAFYVPNQQLDIGYLSLSSTAELKSMEIKTLPDKLIYNPGDELDLSGMVVNGINTDASVRIIENYTVSGYSPTKTGKQTITVKYLDKTAQFDITMNNVEVSELKASEYKTDYLVGEELDLTNMVLTASYANGNTAVVADYEASGFNSDTEGTQTVTISALGKTVDITVRITQPAIYYNDNFDSYSEADITMGRQGTEAKSQSLGQLNLSITGNKNDRTSGFSITNDSNNGYLNIHSGKYATSSRGASFTFNETCSIPAYADIKDGRYLVMSFNAYYADSNSNIQMFGLTTNDTSNGGSAVYDEYLSISRNDKIPQGQWLKVTAAIDNNKEVTLIIRDENGNRIDQRTFIASSDAFEKFGFYGGVSTVGIDNLKVYESTKLESLEVTAPSKTEYALGEEFNPAGMIVTANYATGTSETITVDKYTISGYDPNIAGTQIITVRYGGRTASFTVNVSNERKFKDIIVTPPKKLSYIEGQELDLDGIEVIAEYTGEVQKAVDNYQITGYDKNKIGTQTIYVTYNGMSKTFEVSVIEKALLKIEAVSAKEVYNIGEELEIIVTAFYNNDTTEILNPSLYTVTSDYTPESTEGTYTVNISCNGKSANVDVKVVGRRLTHITAELLKSVYILGDPLEIEVTAYYDNNTTEKITEYTVSGYDSSMPGEQTLTVTYKNKTAIIKVTVNAPEPEYLDVLNDFKDKLTIEKIADETGVTLVISPENDDVLPPLTLYTAIYNEDKSLKSVTDVKGAVDEQGIIRIPLSKPQIQSDESYKLMLWNDEMSPVIRAIDSSDTEFFE